MGQMIDLLFAVRGSQLPLDYRYALWNALRVVLPWIEEEPSTGIVGIRVTPTGGPTALLARRAKLTLRVPAHRASDAARLGGSRIDLGAGTIDIEQSHCRPLAPSATLYSQLVVLESDEESAFLRRLEGELGALGVACRSILGRQGRLGAGERQLAGFPVALHGCSAADSMRLQQMGLGAQRGPGCGIFVPHKRIESVECP